MNIRWIAIGLFSDVRRAMAVQATRRENVRRTPFLPLGQELGRKALADIVTEYASAGRITARLS